MSPSYLLQPCDRSETQAMKGTIGQQHQWRNVALSSFIYHAPGWLPPLEPLGLLSDQRSAVESELTKFSAKSYTSHHPGI